MPLQRIFRAYDEESNHMIYFGLFGTNQGFHIDAEKDLTSMPIMQASGMQDANGDEIYEGDILELTLADGGKIRAECKSGTIRRKNSVGTEIEITGFFFQKPNGYNSFPRVKNYYDKHDLQIMKIVGNFYQNPELRNLCNS